MSRNHGLILPIFCRDWKGLASWVTCHWSVGCQQEGWRGLEVLVPRLLFSLFTGLVYHGPWIPRPLMRAGSQSLSSWLRLLIACGFSSIVTLLYASWLSKSRSRSSQSSYLLAPGTGATAFPVTAVPFLNGRERCRRTNVWDGRRYYGQLCKSNLSPFSTWKRKKIEW